MKKVWPDAASALSDIVADGMLLAIGGFGCAAYRSFLSPRYVTAVSTSLRLRVTTRASMIMALDCCSRRDRFAR